MKRLIRIFLPLMFVSVITLNGLSQSRMPEVKIAPRENNKNANDTLNFEERPYFLLIEQSEKALENEDYENAALRLVEAMAVEPDNELNVALLSNLGMIYYYNEQDSMALVVLDKAIERAPRLISPRQGRARILLGLGRDSEAYKEYENILEIDSINTETRFLHGMMSLYNSQLQKAKDDLEILERIIPQSSKTRTLKATMCSLTGEEIEAISLFRKLIETDPAPEFYGRITACQLALNQLGEASETLGVWMEKYPKDAEAYYYRAMLNKKRYLNDEAQRDAKTAIQLGANRERVAEIFR